MSLAGENKAHNRTKWLTHREMKRCGIDWGQREREWGEWREWKRTKKSERNENGNIQNKVFSSPSILSNYTVKSIFGKLATVWLGVRVHFVGYARIWRVDFSYIFCRFRLNGNSVLTLIACCMDAIAIATDDCQCAGAWWSATRFISHMCVCAMMYVLQQTLMYSL